MGRRDAANIGSHRRDRLEVVVPLVVDRFVRELERRGGEIEEAVRILALETALLRRAVGEGEEFFSEQLARADELFESCLSRFVEEATVIVREHRSEHAEGVLRELVGRDRAECGRNHRHRAARGVAKVVEPDRMHPEAGEDTADLCEFSSRADANGTVALGGDAVDAAEAFGVSAIAGNEGFVHLARHVDERVVGGYFGAVELGEAHGELGAKFPEGSEGAGHERCS